MLLGLPTPLLGGVRVSVPEGDEVQGSEGDEEKDDHAPDEYEGRLVHL